MLRARIQGICLMVLGALLLALPGHAADEATTELYASKCAACHGADGTGDTPVGKMLQVRDLKDPEVQQMTDAQLTAIITKGKEKMPAYEESLTADQISALVAYVRELAQKE